MEIVEEDIGMKASGSTGSMKNPYLFNKMIEYNTTSTS